jgi:uncharacterized membrane protein
MSIEALDRRRLNEIERLALRHAFHDVEQHDIAEFFQANQKRQGAADLTRTNECNLIPRHHDFLD